MSSAATQEWAFRLLLAQRVLGEHRSGFRLRLPGSWPLPRRLALWRQRDALARALDELRDAMTKREWLAAVDRAYGVDVTL